MSSGFTFGSSRGFCISPGSPQQDGQEANPSSKHLANSLSTGHLEMERSLNLPLKEPLSHGFWASAFQFRGPSLSLPRMAKLLHLSCHLSLRRSKNHSMPMLPFLQIESRVFPALGLGCPSLLSCPNRQTGSRKPETNAESPTTPSHTHTHTRTRARHAERRWLAAGFTTTATPSGAKHLETAPSKSRPMCSSWTVSAASTTCQAGGETNKPNPEPSSQPHFCHDSVVKAPGCLLQVGIEIMKRAFTGRQSRFLRLLYRLPEAAGITMHLCGPLEGIRGSWFLLLTKRTGSSGGSDP